MRVYHAPPRVLEFGLNEQIMPSDPKLPPLYRLFRTQPDGDLRASARRHAEGGVAAGTMFWSPRDDRFQAALALAPEEPMAVAALALYLGMLALGDALGTVIPAGVDVSFIWPNRINLNGGYLGSVELDVPPGTTVESTPEWLLLSFDLAVSGGGGAVVDATVTTLEDEGCGVVDTGELLEALARHALVWSNRWHDDGFAPLRPLWIARLETPADLDEAGGLLETKDGERRTTGLIDALGCLA